MTALSDADWAACRYPCMEHDEHVLLTPERFAALSDAQAERDRWKDDAERERAFAEQWKDMLVKAAAERDAARAAGRIIERDLRVVIDELTRERDAALAAALAVDRERIVALMDAERLAEALDHTIIHAEHYECEFVWCQEARAALALHREHRPAEEVG